MHFLVGLSQTDALFKIKLLDISKRELVRTLRKFRGTAWDQSPIFRKVYEEEYGQFGGEPYGVLVGDYSFDHSPPDVQLLSDIAQIAAAAHVPFIADASPTVMQMDSWAELANPRDLTRIFQTPEYTPWRSLRASEDSRYLALCLPRLLGRLPYGTRTEPIEAFDFEEDVEGPDASRFLWIQCDMGDGRQYRAAHSRSMAGASAFAASKAAAWSKGCPCTALPPRTATPTCAAQPKSPSANGARQSWRATASFRWSIASTWRRPHSSARSRFRSRRSTTIPQPPRTPTLSARLPYMFATCRFAHYLKCMVRDKVGSSMDRVQLTQWLQAWLRNYIDGSPGTSSDEWKAMHPLADGSVVIETVEGSARQIRGQILSPAALSA